MIFESVDFYCIIRYSKRVEMMDSDCLDTS